MRYLVFVLALAVCTPGFSKGVGKASKLHGPKVLKMHIPKAPGSSSGRVYHVTGGVLKAF